MKFSIPLLSLLATSQVTLAAPVATVDVAELPSDTILDIRSSNPSDEALVVLDQRATRVCEILDRTVRTIGTSKFTNFWGCLYRNGLASCSTNDLLLAYSAVAHYSESIPKGLPGKRDVDDSQDYLQMWETMLSNSADMSYESLSPLSISSDTIALARLQDEPLPTHRFQITGFAVDDSPKHDIIANHYENGETVLHLPPLQGDSGANSTEGSNLQNRFDNPGFKITFTTRERSKLTQTHQKSMALAGAATWPVYADNFYYRIIPEIKGFGTNYETVDICGGMASYL